jgi:outer membrane protein TolC
MPEWSQETEDRITRRAYEIYEARGREDGRDLDDWLQAERELGAANVRAS